MSVAVPGHADSPAVATSVSEPDAPVRPPRVDALTGLRIFAAVAVYLSHVGVPAGAPGWLGTFLTSGYSGVTLFFVLSGFVLSLNYFEPLRKPRPGTLWTFGVARFARVYPVYLLVLAYAVVAARMNDVSVSPWLGHTLALQAWNADVNYAYSLNPPAWSISVEVFLYACFPLVVFGLARLRSVRSLLLVAGTTIAVMVALAAVFALTGSNGAWGDPGSAHRWLYRSPAARLGDFVLGVVAAQIYVSGWGPRQPGQRGHRALIWLAPAAGLIFCALMMATPLLYTAWSWDVMYAVPAVLLIFGLASAPQTRMSRFLARPTVVGLGAASYAFYLIHMVLIRQLEAGRWTGTLSPMVVVYELLTFGLILAAAVGVHQLFESPVRRWLLRHLARRPPGT